MYRVILEVSAIFGHDHVQDNVCAAILSQICGITFQLDTNIHLKAQR